jgi:hypothetical protein
MFWTTAGVSAALLIAGTITGALALSAESEFNDPATYYHELRGIKDRGESLRNASTATFVIGAAGAVGAAVLFFLADFGGSEKLAASAGPSADGGALVVLGGRF